MNRRKHLIFVTLVILITGYNYKTILQRFLLSCSKKRLCKGMKEKYEINGQFSIKERLSEMKVKTG